MSHCPLRCGTCGVIRVPVSARKTRALNELEEASTTAAVPVPCMRVQPWCSRKAFSDMMKRYSAITGYNLAQ